MNEKSFVKEPNYRSNYKSTKSIVHTSRVIVELIQPAIIKHLTIEKRRQGAGKRYRPFLTVRKVPSKGRVHIRPALTHGRIVHLSSELELGTFLIFDWDLSVNTHW
jgi:hypothetical protein